MQDKSVQNVVRKISTAKRPVSFSGAGLSAESGIATFRDKSENALWSKFDPVQLASQQGFAADPAMVTDWYNWRRKTLSEALPNNAHNVLAKQKGWIHITQNVDHLLEAGGADSDKVLHLHGSLLEDHCNAKCGYSELVDLAAPKGLRLCSECGETSNSYMRPSVVWFGESLPEEVLRRAGDSVVDADLLLVVGTSAQVYPAAGLIDVARQNKVDVVVVNTETSESLAAEDTEIVGKAAEILPLLFQ